MNAQVPLQSVRRQPRIDLEAQVSSRRAGRHPYPTTITNLSPGGCCLELPFGAMVGERIWVTLPGLAPIEAQVGWSGRHLTGCIFSTPLHAAVFETLLTRMQSDA
ncbi:PilZ domain-containing protein [Sphingomicrobium sp. XHP0239]|uniref:PilZ domain-containing protein n=1 Tax=Sphingomicrobium maritimum TaxID=3133972 RepID=UPI0031CC64AF